MTRIAAPNGNTWKAYEHPACFATATGPAGPRLRVGGAHDPGALFRMLVVPMEGPYVATYILHTPRTEARPGRYRSPTMTLGELRIFFERFQPFLTADGRHDFMIEAPKEQTTVLWDRHDIMTIEGNLDHAVEVLETLDFARGELTVPTPHRHMIDETRNQEETDLLGVVDWRWADLELADHE